MFEFNPAMIYFFIRRFHYRKSSIRPRLSNKPPPPPHMPFQGKKVNGPPFLLSPLPSPLPDYSSLTNDGLY